MEVKKLLRPPTMGKDVINAESVLLITLDSCRYDAFQQARAPNMRAVAPLHRAQAPSHFTYGSHAAMFVGFTPGIAAPVPLLNPKNARVFRLSQGGSRGFGKPAFDLTGADIIDGFRNAGHATMGTAAMGWFNPETSVSRTLTGQFDHFFFAGRRGVRLQADWIAAQMAEVADRPIFAFMNIGETHVPYHFEGAPWSFKDNPCVAFQTVDRSAECRQRQIACVEYVDGVLSPLLQAFAGATVLLCADHGDCWGEDGLWEHGISHPKTLEVPLILRHRGQPV